MANEVAAANAGNNLQQRYEAIEQRRQRIVVYLGNGVACAFLVGFGIANLSHERHVLAAFTFVHALVTLFNILLFKLTRNKDWAGYGFAYGIVALFTYLVASGGVDNTGPLWGYPMVAVAVSLLGPRLSLVAIAMMLCIASVLFFVPIALIEVASYSPVFKVRFVASFAAVSLFTALHEIARARSQKALIRVSEQLDRLSHTDALTGLANRRYMMERLEGERSRFVRHGHAFSILYGDLDNFKLLNDSCGHQAGDAALQAVAQTLRSVLRQHDELSRWGGEEFLVLLPQTDERVAAEVAEKLRAAVAAIDFEYAGKPVALTMSFGAHTAVVSDDIDALIHCADQKLYQAKKIGKNCVVAQLQAA